MKSFFWIIILSSCFAALAQDFKRPQSPSFESGGGGNGGDYIRMKFIDVGNFVLQNYKEGLKEIESLSSIDDLRRTLDIKYITVSGDPLLDNGGSKVDALGSKGKIVLYEGNIKEGTGWYGIFNKADLVERLVLHEMLRAAGVNDDNYIYSSRILTKYDVSFFDKTAYTRWCSESASFIESALEQGMRAKTSEQEVLIYTKALNLIESLISPKHFYFIEPSVQGAAKAVLVFKHVRNRVNFMRLALRQIAVDIRYVDSQIKSRQSFSGVLTGDHAKYALSYVRSAKKFTMLSETHETEGILLDIVFDQVYAYMVNSDYSRVKYGELFSQLDSARNTPVLGYKRQALQYIATLLR